MKMKIGWRIFIISLISFLNIRCDDSNYSYEIGISNALTRKSFFSAENCNSDLYYNILIKNDSLFVDGKLDNETGNYFKILKNDETEYLTNLINEINPKNRREKEVIPTTGMTALFIKKNGITLDSLVNFKTKWNQSDFDLFNYIGELICENELVVMNDSINYPTWIMIEQSE